MMCSWHLVCILSEKRVAVENATQDARALREHFNKKVDYIREVYRVMPGKPEWLTIVDVLPQFIMY